MQVLQPAQIDAEATVESTLLRFPQAAAAFFDRQMACVGCVMSCFDTIADAARIYGVPLEVLLGEIAALANPGPLEPQEAER